MVDYCKINLENTIKSGQVFLWKQNQNKWYGINGQDVLRVNDSGIIKSFTKQKTDFFRKKDPTEKDLHELTGLTLSEVRRCKIILDFPTRVQDLILKEVAKTSKEKKLLGKEKLLTADFFIEIHKNIIRPLEEKNLKLFIKLGGKEGIFDKIIKKRRDGEIKNIVSLRPLSKYLRKHPRKGGEHFRKFLLKDNYSLEKILIESGLEFDPYLFKRNMRVFSGNLKRVPKDITSEFKKEISKLLKDMKKEIEKKLEELKR